MARGRKAGSRNKGNAGFRWSKKLNPDSLFPSMEPTIRETVAKSLRELGPKIHAELVRRIRKSGKVAKDGRLVDIAPYSKGYVRMLEKAGESTKADLTLWGNGLLDHLAARVKESDGKVLFTLAPFGSSPGTERTRLRDKVRGIDAARYSPDGKRIWVEATRYTRRDPRTKGTVEVDVPGHWRPVRQSKRADEPKKRLTYQSIANQLSNRLGHGKWAKGVTTPPSSFLTLTTDEVKGLEAAVLKRDVKAIALLIFNSISRD